MAGSKRQVELLQHGDKGSSHSSLSFNSPFPQTNQKINMRREAYKEDDKEKVFIQLQTPQSDGQVLQLSTVELQCPSPHVAIISN